MTTRSLGWTVAAAVAVPAVGLSVLLLDPTGFPMWRGGAYTDLLVSHWPIAAFIRHSIVTWHQVPLWNPLFLSGMPLTADPLAGFWYGPNVLAWLSATGLGVNALFWAHLGLAAVGLMRLLRAEGASQTAAFVGGLAFAATPKLVGHIGVGHLTLVEAVAWTPWVLLAVRHAVDKALDPSGRLFRYGVVGALLGVTFVIDPRWLIPAGLLGVAYLGKCLAHSQPRAGRITVGRSVFALLVGVGTASPMLIPLLELLPRTTRWGLTLDAAQELSLPPSRLLGAGLFDGGGSPETQTYLGGTIVLLLAAGAAMSLRRGRFWTSVLAVSLILAFGSYTPVYGWLLRIVPGMSLMRVPARFYLVGALAAAMLAGHAIDHLAKGPQASGATRRARLVTVGAGGLMLMLAIAASLLRGQQPDAGLTPAWAVLAGGVLACAAAGCVLAALSRPAPARLALGGLVALVALDLGWANVFTLRVEPAGAALATKVCGATGEATAFGTRRVFSPSYSVPQQVAPLCGLELADGVNPLQLEAYWDAMASATGFESAMYGVTLPPFADGDLLRDWQPAIDPDSLGLLNVTRIVSAYPLPASSLEGPSHQGEWWVYENPQARPRAWVEREGAGDGG